MIQDQWSETTSETRKSTAMSTRRPKSRNRARNLLALLTRATPKAEPKPADSEQPDMLVERRGPERIKQGTSVHSVFEQLFPRVPMMGYESMMSSETMKKLSYYIGCTKSTADSLADNLMLDEDHRQKDTFTRDPLDYLCAIIQSDTLNLLYLINLTLSEIGRHMLDNTLIQRRLVHWRYLLEHFDTELNQLEVSLKSFINFLKSFHYGSQGFPSIEARITECTNHIALLKHRTKRTFKSLMANMLIVESERGIAEAESVTKLTELAFFFIPLTFSASIFSMQVKELTSTEISLWAFFVLAIIITTCSYTLRLIIRSKQVIRRRQNLLNQVREDSRLQLGDPIPTTAFLVWFWRRVRSTRIMILIGITIVSAGLLSAIWTRPIINNIKLGITLLISIMLFLPLGWVIVKVLYSRIRKRATAENGEVGKNPSENVWLRWVYHTQVVSR